MSARWLSLVVLAGGVERLDAALERAVAPAMASTCAELEVRRWYFVRYVDERGPYIRLDLLTADPDAAERVVRAHLEQGLENLDGAAVREPVLSPPASWRREPARRGVERRPRPAETGRFAGDELAAAEELFQASSETVLGVLPALPRGRQRFALGLRLMGALSQAGIAPGDRAGFWDDVARGWTGEDERGARLLERLRRHAAADGPALVDEARRLAEGEPITPLLETYAKACDEALAAAADDARPFLVREHAHLTANRLGVAPLEEALLACVLARGEAGAADDTSPPALVLEGVTKRGDQHPVLDDVSLEVREGEAFAILGPDGAGKSSLLGVAAGLRVTTGGEVRVLGRDPRTDRDKLGSEMAVALPDDQLVDESTARENLSLLRRDDGGRTADEVLTMIGLSDQAGTPALELDVGERRLLAIGAALVRAPRVVLLDEPTAGLSPVERERVWMLMGRLRRDGTTVVFTTSSLQDAISASGRVALFIGGAVAEVAEPSAIAEQFPERVVRFRTTEQPDAMLLDDLPEARHVDVVEHPGYFAVEVTTLQPDELLKLVGSDPAFPEIVWVAPEDLEGTFARPACEAAAVDATAGAG